MSRKLSEGEKDVSSRDKERRSSKENSCFVSISKEEDDMVPSPSSCSSTSHTSPSTSMSSIADTCVTPFKVNHGSSRRYSDNIVNVFDVDSKGIHASRTHKSPFKQHTIHNSCSGGGHTPRAVPRRVQKSNSLKEPCITATSNRPKCPIPEYAFDAGSSLKPTGMVSHATTRHCEDSLTLKCVIGS